MGNSKIAFLFCEVLGCYFKAEKSEKHRVITSNMELAKRAGGSYEIIRLMDK